MSHFKDQEEKATHAEADGTPHKSNSDSRQPIPEGLASETGHAGPGQAQDQDSIQAGAFPKDLEDQLKEALAKVKAWEDEYLRARADMDNLRKRSAQEVISASKFAIESFAEGLLPVADSLEMALSLENQTPEGLRSGVELTLKQLQQAFQKGRLLAINPVGEKFDPNRHQAVSMVDGAGLTPPVAPNHVVQVMQKGYMVSERVLRPAIVVVAQP